jgi:EAL domain-containing protein (putative c-di-GMP-specific phosphodiesterase class I)
MTISEFLYGYLPDEKPVVDAFLAAKDVCAVVAYRRLQPYQFGRAAVVPTRLTQSTPENIEIEAASYQGDWFKNTSNHPRQVFWHVRNPGNLTNFTQGALFESSVFDELAKKIKARSVLSVCVPARVGSNASEDFPYTLHLFLSKDGDTIKESLRQRHNVLRSALSSDTMGPFGSAIYDFLHWQGIYLESCSEARLQYFERQMQLTCVSWFQPIVRLPFGPKPKKAEITIEGYEALAREIEGTLAKGTFPTYIFDTAERHIKNGNANFSEALDFHFIASAIRRFQDSGEIQRGRKLSVNASVTTVGEHERRSKLVNLISRLEAETDNPFDQDQLGIEINEAHDLPAAEGGPLQSITTFRDNFRESFQKHKMNQDDFGVHHANVIRTAAFRPDWIKFDQLFCGLLNSDDSRMWKAAMLSSGLLAKELNSNVVLEGYRLSPRVVSVAYTNNIEFGQGFDLAIPSPTPLRMLDEKVKADLYDLVTMLPSEAANVR